MHPNLQPLSPILLSALGRTHRQEELAKALESLPQPVLNLRQHQEGKLYPVSAAPYGLDLMLQCTNPEAEEAQRLWGLHSLTLHTEVSDPQNFWPFAWPEGLEKPGTAKVADVAKLFGADNETSMVTPAMACFTLNGPDEQVWSMVCMFDNTTEHLQTMSLVRTGEWIVDASNA